MYRLLLLFLIITIGFIPSVGQSYLLQPDFVFDGTELKAGMQVYVQNGMIKQIGNSLSVHDTILRIPLKGKTLLPGLIEGHAHILLHPYNETAWNDQVLFEAESERVVRAINHLQKSLEAGITTIRDLGTEGAGYADVGIKTAIAKKLLIAPDLIVAGKAMVTTGSYGPKSAAFNAPLGAEAADGHDVIRVVRDQIGRGADLVKIYADYRWGIFGQAMPTFSIDEIKLIVETAAASGRVVVAHASTKEGMRRAILGGVKTIEHGDDADEEIFTLMKKYDVAICPTLAAVESIAAYRGWKKGTDPDTDRIIQKKKSFKSALDHKVKIIFGGDVGVFAHGENVKELFLMNEYGMTTTDCLRSATFGNAQIFGLLDRGRVQIGLKADLIAVEGNPLGNLHTLKNVNFVMIAGKIIKH